MYIEELPVFAANSAALVEVPFNCPTNYEENVIIFILLFTFLSNMLIFYFITIFLEGKNN